MKYINITEDINLGEVFISDFAIAKMAAMTALETETLGLSHKERTEDLLKRLPTNKYIRSTCSVVEVNNELEITLNLKIKNNINVIKDIASMQKNVKETCESFVDFKVSKVDINIIGVDFD